MTFRATSFALLLLFCGCREEILHDLDEPRANQILLLLNESGIVASKARTGTLWGISVSKSEAFNALRAIDQSRVLIRDLNRYKADTSSLMQSREDRAQAGMKQLAWSLETTLERIPGVKEAKVHLRLPVDSTFSLGKSSSTGSASGLLIVAQDDASLVEQAKRLISGATGLVETQVSVVVSKIEHDVPAPEPVLSQSPPESLVRSGPIEVDFKLVFVALLAIAGLGILGLVCKRLLHSRARKELAPLRPRVESLSETEHGDSGTMLGDLQ